MEVSPEKARELEPLIQNHKSHITRLEQVMRLLENEQARHYHADSFIMPSKPEDLSCPCTLNECIQIRSS